MLTLLLLVAAYVPPLAWLWFLRSRDRYEPEPKRLVINLFLLGIGASVPALALRGVVNELIPPTHVGGVAAVGLGPSLDVSAIVVVLLVALIAEVTKYLFASSRIRRDPNFDEPVDGMIYLASVGLGFAAAVNAQYVVATFNASLDLSPAGSGAFVAGLQVAVIAVVLTTLAHASFSGIAGYFLSRHVLFGRPFTYVLTGLAVATVLNGLYGLALPGIGGSPDQGLLGLLPRTLVVVGSLGVFVFLFRSSLRESPRRQAALGPSRTAARGTTG